MYKPKLQITQIGTVVPDGDDWKFQDWHFSSVYINEDNKPLNPVVSFMTKLLFKAPAGIQVGGSGLERLAGWPLGTLLLVASSLRKDYDKTIAAQTKD